MERFIFLARELLKLGGDVFRLFKAERQPNGKRGRTMINGVTMETRGAGRSLQLSDFGAGKITTFTPSALGANWQNVNALAAYRLNSFLNALAYPFRITSAWRSPEKNRAVGGADDSKHLTGKAFDIQIDDPHFYNPDRTRFYRDLSLEAGFNGFGVYEPGAAIHVDIRDRLASWGAIVEGGKRVYISLAKFLEREGGGFGAVAVAVIGAGILLALWRRLT